MRLSSSFLSDMGEISVKRITARPRSKIVGEVVAIFSSVDVRDAIKGAARELAGCSDAGIRLEIPQYLQPSLKALETVSYNLKQKNPMVKRNIKFDDAEMDLVLDFCMDPGVDDPRWRKVRPAQAKVLKAALGKNVGVTTEVTTDELEQMLDVGQPENDST